MKIEINSQNGSIKREIIHAYFINVPQISNLIYLLIKVNDDQIQEYYIRNFSDDSLYTWNKILSKEEIKKKIDNIDKSSNFVFNGISCKLNKLTKEEITNNFKNKKFNEIQNYERIINFFK